MLFVFTSGVLIHINSEEPPAVYAEELMDKYSDLTLIDYGFVYHRDYIFPNDDLTRFLLQKK
jgi:hypothetical protein